MSRGLSRPRGQEKIFFFSRTIWSVLSNTQRTWSPSRTSMLEVPKDFGINGMQKKRRRKKRDKDAGNQSQTTDVEEGRVLLHIEHGDEARSTKEYCAYLLICASVAWTWEFLCKWEHWKCRNRWRIKKQKGVGSMSQVSQGSNDNLIMMYKQNQKSISLHVTSGFSSRTVNTNSVGFCALQITSEDECSKL